MRYFFFLLFLFHLPGSLYSQNSFETLYHENIRPLIGKEDSVWFMNLPELKMDAHHRNHILPPFVNNAELPYFPPIFNQIGPSCGQAAGVSYLFTYEMCRARNVPAADSTNSFPSHFVFNFMTYNGWYGVSYLHSFEVLRMLGSPSIAQYGGMAIDDGRLWLTGYEKYHQAMQNRIKEVYRIDVSAEEGLYTLKHWLKHRLEGSDIGGMAIFNAASPWSLQFLPQGTPEAGKRVITQFPGNVATHAMTIVGYNDSIRFDYNGDGQYTNHLDINGDGVVDMRDWEIGGLKFANSYGADWADSGYAYMMYKTLAENVHDGGIWNGMVNVIDVHRTYEPLLTMKLKIKHNRREHIRIVAGVSADTNRNTPEHYLYFPAFNFQGGPNYMQGYNTHDSLKTIEIGLDISPLLNYIEPGMASDFYLEVHENDPFQQGQGEILSFAVVDYTQTEPIEIVSAQQQIPITDHDITRLGLRHTPQFDKVRIITEEIPVFDASFQLESEGGIAPFHWEFVQPYHHQYFVADFPEIVQTELELEGPNYKFASQELEFSFPFYGSYYNEVFVHKDGFILFDPEIYPWPYYQDTYVLFRTMRNISAFLFTPVKYYSRLSEDEGIWYEGDASKAAFRWKQPLYYADVNLGYGEFAIVLYPDGSIEFYYNELLVEESILWYAGVSAGDNSDFTLLHGSHYNELPTNFARRLVPELISQGYSITDEGSLMGKPEDPSRISNLTIKVEDDKRSTDRKTFQMSDILRFEYTFLAAEDTKKGSDLVMNLTVHNMATTDITDLVVSISSDDPWIQVVEDQAYFGLVQANSSESKVVFGFELADNCPDRHTLLADITFESNLGEQFGVISYEVTAAQTVFAGWRIEDNDNNHLDPGEKATMMIKLSNLGRMAANNIKAEISCEDPYITIYQPSELDFGTIQPFSTVEMGVEVSVAAECPIEHEAVFSLTVTESESNLLNVTYTASIGQYAFLVYNKAKNDQSVNALMSVLDSLNIDYRNVEVLPEKMDIYRAAIVCLGTYYSNTQLSQIEGNILAEFLEHGGRLYLEGTQFWHTDPITPVHNKFKIDKQNISPPLSFSELHGVEDSFMSDFSFSFSGEQSILFIYLVPLDEAIPLIHTDGGEQTYTMIANADGLYKTVGSLLEFSSFGSNDDFELRKGFMIELIRYFNMDHLLFIDLPELNKPTDNVLLEVSPNPFVHQVDVTVHWPKFEAVKMQVFSQKGKLLFVSDERPLIPGAHSNFNWYGTDMAGDKLPSGVYVLEFRSKSISKTTKLIKLE